MRSILLNIFLPGFLFSSLLFSQQFSAGSPEWLVEKFFKESTFSEKANYYTGEMLNDINNPSIGEELDGRGIIQFHKIKDSENEKVFTLEVNVDDRVIDFYCFLVLQAEGWKIGAVRRFLLPAFIYTAYDSLSNLNSLSANNSTFYLSLKLFTMNDSELKNYLNAHVTELDLLVAYFDQEQSDKIKQELSSLGCNAIFKDRKYPGCVFIQILAFDKMEAGFLYSSESSKLPEVSPNHFIYIEEVVPGWFIYRII